MKEGVLSHSSLVPYGVIMGRNYNKQILFGIVLINLILVGGLFYLFMLSDFRRDDIDRCNVGLLESSLVGESLPKYDFVNQNGADVFQELTRGNVLMIVFLSHCQACLREFDFLRRNYDEQYSPFRVIAVTGESTGIVSQFVETHELNFAVYLDVRGSLMHESRVSCTPTLFFLENGVVRKITVGITQRYDDLTEGFK